MASLFDSKDLVLQLTDSWTGERFENGRPRVDDHWLSRLRELSIEEIYGGIWSKYPKGYGAQFQGGFKSVHPGKVLIGRAVTAVMAPYRVDLDASLKKMGKSEGRTGFYNSWVIDIMEDGDVMVVDMFDKVREGTFVGGNLSTAVQKNSGDNSGCVIWGGLRDIKQVSKVPIQSFYRGYDPTAIMEVVMIGMNVPCRIGNAICLPGDVVYANEQGVMFIPPHLVEHCVRKAEQAKVRDIFGFQRIEEEVYTASQMDSPWTAPIWTDFLKWFENEAAEEFKYLDFDDAIEADKNTDAEVRL